VGWARRGFLRDCKPEVCSGFWNQQHTQLAWTQDIDDFVQEIVSSLLGLNKSNRRLKPVPLLLPIQSALAQQDEARMQFGIISQIEKIGNIGGYYSHLMLQSKGPDNAVRLAGEPHMRDCLREDAYLCELCRKRRRDVLVKQQTQSHAARVFLRN
jgi:hypothetical protein